MEEKKEIEYYSINACIKCEAKLINEYIFYNNGTCPFCGNTSEGTMCDTKKIILGRDVIKPKAKKKSLLLSGITSWFNKKYMI